MKKLRNSSVKYLEKKTGRKARPLPKGMQKKLEEASAAANEKIKLNNAIYMQSNAHSHETIVSSSNIINNEIDQFVDLLNTTTYDEEIFKNDTEILQGEEQYSLEDKKPQFVKKMRIK